MIKLSLFCVVLLHFSVSFAQSSNTDTGLSHLTKLDAGLQGIGFTYERRLSDKITIDLSAGEGGGYDIAESYISNDLSNPAFYLSVTPKYYYNRKKRSAQGKNMLFNAGNYIGFRLKYSLPNDRLSYEVRNSLLVNIHWGIQRPLGKRWILNTHVGAGYAQDTEYEFGTVYPAIDCKFSYVISRRKG